MQRIKRKKTHLLTSQLKRAITGEQDSSVRFLDFFSGQSCTETGSGRVTNGAPQDLTDKSSSRRERDVDDAETRSSCLGDNDVSVPEEL